MKKRRRAPLVPVVAGLALGAMSLLALAAIARSSGLDREDYWQTRRDQMDDPELWSIEALPSRPEWPPVTICADARSRTGFAQSMPTVGRAGCVPTEPAHEGKGYVSVRCMLGNQLFLSTTSFKGELASDFITTTWISDANSGSPRYQQVRRFRRLGACPSDWEVGNHTDSIGRHLKGGIRISPSAAILAGP